MTILRSSYRNLVRGTTRNLKPRDVVVHDGVIGKGIVHHLWLFTAVCDFGHGLVYCDPEKLTVVIAKPASKKSHPAPFSHPMVV